MMPPRLAITGLLAVALIACTTAPDRQARPGPNSGGANERRPVRIVAAIQSDPGTLNFDVNPPGAGVPGLDVLETLVSSGLTTIDNTGQVRALLAEAVPTVENGLWRLFPDGRMETSWTLRANPRWHDGIPFTSADLAFGAAVLQDKDLDILPNVAFQSVESIETPDARTVRILWRRPFIRADSLFEGSPMPKHLLERTYIEEKATLTQLPYWTQEFIGNGPFRVVRFTAGSHVLLQAYDDYTLGRPKIDEIEVRFIPDSSTLAANVLAGAVELTLGRSLSLEQGIQVAEQWQGGRMEVDIRGWIVAFPQFINPSPSVIADVRFRRALMHAINRQEMADTLMFGRVPVAHTFLSPSDPQYSSVERQLARYDFDPRRAAKAIEELGYARTPDGGFRDSGGQRLALEIRASTGRDLNTKAILAIADYWQRLGIAADPVVMPQQRARDREYVQTFPGFLLYNQPNDLNSLNRIRSSQTPLPENNFVGNNNSRYMSAELEALIDRHFSTIPTAQRIEILGQILRHMSENLSMMGMFYNAEVSMIANRLRGVGGRGPEGSMGTANVHEWTAE